MIENVNIEPVTTMPELEIHIVVQDKALLELLMQDEALSLAAKRNSNKVIFADNVNTYQGKFRVGQIFIIINNSGFVVNDFSKFEARASINAEVNIIPIPFHDEPSLVFKFSRALLIRELNKIFEKAEKKARFTAEQRKTRKHFQLEI